MQQVRLKTALTQLKEHFEKMAHKKGSASGAVASTAGKLVPGTWQVLPVPYILGLSGEEKLPDCRTLLSAGVLQTVHATEEELLQGGGAFEHILVISHRWEDPSHPDPACTKLNELQEVLSEREDIKSVWWDYPCLPQGEKTEEERAFFDAALRNINLLYLHGNVVVFLDKMYGCRFWPGYEFFLCTHRATPEGLVSKSMDEVRRRVTIIEIGASAFTNGKDTEAILATWLSRDTAMAIQILSQDDMDVTNKTDKEILLKILKAFEERVKRMGSFEPAWCDAVVAAKASAGHLTGNL